MEHIKCTSRSYIVSSSTKFTRTLTNKCKALDPKAPVCFSQKALWAQCYNLPEHTHIHLFTDEPTLFPDDHSRFYNTKVLDLAKWAITHGHDITVTYNTAASYTLSYIPTATRKQEGTKVVTTARSARVVNQETELSSHQWSLVEQELYALRKYSEAFTRTLTKNRDSVQRATLYNENHYRKLLTSSEALETVVKYVNTWATAYDVPRPQRPTQPHNTVRDWIHYTYVKNLTVDDISSESEESSISKTHQAWLDYVSDLYEAYITIATYKKNGFDMSLNWIACPHCSKPINIEGTAPDMRVDSGGYTIDDQMHLFSPNEYCPHCSSYVSLSHQRTLNDIKERPIAEKGKFAGLYTLEDSADDHTLSTKKEKLKRCGFDKFYRLLELRPA